MAVDLELFCDMRLAAATDDVAHTVDYTQVADRVLTIAQTERFHLLEALAERLAQAILAQFSVSARSEEHTSELQSPCNLVCRLLLEKKKHKICLRTATVCASDWPRPCRNAFRSLYRSRVTLLCATLRRGY